MCAALNSVYKVLTVEYTSPDHSTQVFMIRHNGIRQIKQGWIYTPLRHVKHKVRKNGVVCWECLCQPNGFFKNHQPTRGYTGNHCTISMYTLEKPWKFFKNETQKLYSGGFLSGGFLSWGVFVWGVFVGGFMSQGVFVRGVFVLEPSWVQQGDIMCTLRDTMISVGDIMSTPGDVQYTGVCIQIQLLSQWPSHVSW